MPYKQTRQRIAGMVARYSPGLALAVALTVLAMVGQALETRLLGHPVVDGVALAILLGMIVRALQGTNGHVDPGISFAGKQGLEVAVVLLGASINLPALIAAGPRLIVAASVAVIGGIGLSLVLSWLLGLRSKLAILVACGSSICGNSAIAAVAPVIDADVEDVAASIALTALLGVVLVLALPWSMVALGFSPYQYGVLAGLTVYAVPQVLAATLPVSVLSGQIGTAVKLLRVLMLGPVVTFFALRYGRSSAASHLGVGRFVPWFLVGFVVLGVMRSTGVLPLGVADALREASRLLTVLAMAALGLGVDLAAIRAVGRSVAVAVLGSLALLIVLSSVLIRVLEIG